MSLPLFNLPGESDDYLTPAERVKMGHIEEWFAESFNNFEGVPEDVLAQYRALEAEFIAIAQASASATEQMLAYGELITKTGLLLQAHGSYHDIVFACTQLIKDSNRTLPLDIHPES